jgi:hypothetical protein
MSDTEKTVDEDIDDKDFGPASIGAMMGVCVGLCIHSDNSLEDDLIPWIGVMHDNALAQTGEKFVRLAGVDGELWEVHGMMSLVVAFYAHHGVGRDDLFALVRDLHADISNAAAEHRKLADAEAKFYGEKKRK